MRVLPLLLLMTISCSCGSEEYREASTNPAFLPYITSFEADYKKKVTTAIIFKDKLPTKWAASCVRWEVGGKVVYKEIKVKTEYWNKIDENRRQQIIDHELGHCELNKGHDNRIFPNGMKTSVMHKTAFTEIEAEYYKKYFSDYRNQLLRD